MDDNYLLKLFQTKLSPLLVGVVGVVDADVEVVVDVSAMFSNFQFHFKTHIGTISTPNVTFIHRGIFRRYFSERASASASRTRPV